ncbi:HET-domain-containing protein [Massarina eburnea CBS 473.64]|uniref:HET-domain-containing protein n=1 Tax=Massarina eburnea CBS 473.64 TaxID=1395130 RepID=A0A6A6RIJ6_9PLEO|nr:HET-domain-containing protein [Massarina eburnea CBS 473.64]
MSRENITSASNDIDLGKIGRWHTVCNTRHGDCCTDRNSEALAQMLDHLILVDVRQRRLVKRPTSTPYVALSYVWGNVKTLKTTSTNIEKLSRDDALCTEGQEDVLPETIRDAMLLVNRLGGRYLWVDCLCVIQDAGMEEMNKMLSAMARIYASAEFTIVSARGEDATYGLEGIGAPAKPRVLPNNMVPMSETAKQRHRTEVQLPPANEAELGLVSVSKEFKRDGFPWNSKWASRGWTFQEALFSRRLLVFDNVLSWVCGRCIWLEERDDIGSPPLSTTSATEWPSERPHLGVPMGLMSMITNVNVPTLGRWGMIIENYSTRNLTYDKDITRALAGATEVMTSNFPGGLLHGLPPFFFDIAILWQPRGNLVRRDGAPSWSWTGWKGAVDCLASWYPFYAGVYRDTGSYTDWVPSTVIRPLAKWAYIPCLGSSTENDVAFNGFYEYTAMRKDPRLPLPIGWKRHAHYKGDFFTRSDSETTGFRYSCPLPQISHSKSPITTPPLLSAFLRCTAPTAKVSIDYSQTLPGFSVVLLESHGQTIGALRLSNCEDQPSLSHVEEEMCELVAISEAEVPIANRYSNHPLLPVYFSQLSLSLSPENLGFYNVLWFERKDDVAYRKGLGIVGKRFWDGLEVVYESLVLG